MKKYIKLLVEERNTIEKEINDIKNSLRKAPEDDLRITTCNGSIQFYKKNINTRKNGKYISKKNKEEIRRLVQKKYDKELLDALTEKFNEINSFLIKNDEKEKVWDEKEYYDEMPNEVRKYISRYEIDDEEYVKKWLDEKYIGKSFEYNDPEIFTEKGERVRSKSEKMIADKLYLMNIPYKYEKPIYLAGYGTVYPDFIILDIANRREYILEHLGMMDNEQYVDKAMAKINLYIKNGIYLGDKLILTFETNTTPLNMKEFEKMIKNLFKR